MIPLAFVVAVLPYTLQTTAAIVSIDHDASSILLVVFLLAIIAITTNSKFEASPAELSVFEVSLIAIVVGIGHHVTTDGLLDIFEVPFIAIDCHWRRRNCLFRSSCRVWSFPHSDRHWYMSGRQYRSSFHGWTGQCMIYVLSELDCCRSTTWIDAAGLLLLLLSGNSDNILFWDPVVLGMHITTDIDT